ncbi:MAG: tRNA preQ1(34) S-adenosylmethionine ribosyltransferase-isomerase QueA [Bacteroidales bacterium]|jgi:S-adenosylmethionine:tRNA ribosyltransferase-isomerase|nr:tRNA preQ1(34) S-adenosylmethionine ribosyltransferase-isomerase QueA [Bacteroidales bacterium]
MKLSQFKYFLPQELIALHPLIERDVSRLMVLNRKTRTIEHRIFKDILEYFEEGDLFVVNNTRVFPALLYGEKEKTQAQIRVFLLRELDANSRLWDVLVDPARKIRIGNKLYFGEDNSLVAEVIDNTTSRGRTLRFLFEGNYMEFRAKLKELGNTPLPENILRFRDVESEDEENYQTLFATIEGAVAVPTSGLHFSREIIKRFELHGVDIVPVTLHSGLGNFRDIDVEDLTKHKSDSEQMMITEESATKINYAKDQEKKICAVGTTTIKALESSMYQTGKIKSYDGWTSKFIFPPHRFLSADALVTNFHPSESPMLMIAAAFGGFEFVMKAYKEAIAEKYRFLTYGDAMLII